MSFRLPLFALLLGLAGLLPFIGTGLGALGPSDGSAQWLLALLGFGVLPSLVGWVALLMPIFLRYQLAAEIGIGLEIAGFAGVMLAEQRLYRAQLMPSGYLWLRWG